MVAAWRYGLPDRKTYDLSGKTGEECIYDSCPTIR
ncbi:Uncharacterised protein [Segatella copri]|nr:Uncharacterised protein [Segatella copri]